MLLLLVVILIAEVVIIAHLVGKKYPVVRYIALPIVIPTALFLALTSSALIGLAVLVPLFIFFAWYFLEPEKAKKRIEEEMNRR